MNAPKQIARSTLAAFGLEARRIKAKAAPALAPELEPEMVAGCRLMASREQWLETLPADSVGAEIGVANGDFSAAILERARPRNLILIDAWHSDRYADGADAVRQRFAREIDAGRVEIRRGLSTDVLPTLAEGSLDWAYIDTTHGYELTREELAICEGVVRPDGRIAGHDYCEGNAADAVPYGVIRAVHEFCLERRWAFDCLALAPDGHMTFSLKKMASD